ncbi:hypothetical protein Ancab_015837 [Ancistrocladus abbreviatus]
MDSAERLRGSKSRFHLVLIRCFLAFVLSFSGVFSLVIVAAFLAFPFGNLSIRPRISVPSQCKIVSSSVDLSSSKVCELGLLNFKAKHVFYPSEKKKFRCHYDYYWASVFKVECKDHFSGQTLLGLAEAPKEALPHDCRPSFGTSLLTKDKFKVNESYDCWYTSGLSKVDIYQGNYFSCQVKDPPSIEMINRYFLLSTRVLHSWLSGQDIASGVGWGMIVGACSGFFASTISVGLFKMLQSIIFWLPQGGVLMMVSLIHRMRLCRVFFLLIYFSIVGWLTVQYGKNLGIPVTSVNY